MPILPVVDAHYRPTMGPAAVGEALWSMDDQPEAYVVVEAGTQPDPADAPKPTPTFEVAACYGGERPDPDEREAETLDALQKENEMLKQCLLEMSETVYA